MWEGIWTNEPEDSLPTVLIKVRKLRKQEAKK